MTTGNKIISFSLWGNMPKYIIGAVENIRLQKIFYPEWTCRFYIDSTIPADVVNRLKEGAQVCSMAESDGNFGLFWRFLPLDDTSVERFIVRDADSRLSAREADAVKEWEESGKWFHLMRDHAGHITTSICGAMWGATSEFCPGYTDMISVWLANNANRMGHERGKYFYTDQLFLDEIIWPLVKDNHIAHESIISRYTGDKRPFRVANPDGSFVGQQIEL